MKEREKERQRERREEETWLHNRDEKSAGYKATT